MPKSVTVVLSGNTLVVTLHEALSPAERDMAQSPEGAAKVQEFHRQLFSSSAIRCDRRSNESRAPRCAKPPPRLSR
jgi:uncharacterized protein YbcI